MHPDTDLEQFYTRSHLPGVPRPFHQLPPDERIDWAKRMEKAQFEAWAKLHHYDLTRCSHEPYAAYRSDLTNAALAGWRGAKRALEPFECAAPKVDERAAWPTYDETLAVYAEIRAQAHRNPIGYIEAAELEKLGDPEFGTNIESYVRLWHPINPPSRALIPVYAAPTTPTGLVTPASLSTDATAQLSTDSVDNSVHRLTDEQIEAIRYARSVMGSVSWETPDSVRAKSVLDALLAPTAHAPPRVTIETAIGNDLDAIGNEWYMRRLVGEPCDGYRARIKDRIEEFKEWRAAKGVSQ